MGSLDRGVVIERLRALDRADPARKVFGAAVHQYELNPPLPTADVERFEQQHEVSLPQDYREFITQVGNGGAGPAYGLFPLGQHDDGHGLGAWERGGLVGPLNKAFPHIEAWNLHPSFWQLRPDPGPDISLEEEDRLMEEWDRRLDDAGYWSPDTVRGAIPICHLGCAIRQWLVVSGPERGNVWLDARVDDGGLSPLAGEDGSSRVTFSEWYGSWLHDCAASADLEA